MKIAVVGLGSMGLRRIRLIKQIESSAEIIGVDTNAERRDRAVEQHNISCVESLDMLAADLDCIFVCTPPLSHAKIINQCLHKGWNVFTELNLVPDLYDENISLAKEKGLVLFLSSTFLYREEVKYIESQVKNSACKLNYIYHIGQYLPTGTLGNRTKTFLSATNAPTDAAKSWPLNFRGSAACSDKSSTSMSCRTRCRP